MGAKVENGTLVWQGAGGRLVWESEVGVAVLGMVHGGSVVVDWLVWVAFVVVAWFRFGRRCVIVAVNGWCG